MKMTAEIARVLRWTLSPSTRMEKMYVLNRPAYLLSTYVNRTCRIMPLCAYLSIYVSVDFFVCIKVCIYVYTRWYRWCRRVVEAADEQELPRDPGEQGKPWICSTNIHTYIGFTYLKNNIYTLNRKSLQSGKNFSHPSTPEHDDSKHGSRHRPIDEYWSSPIGKKSIRYSTYLSIYDIQIRSYDRVYLSECYVWMF